MLCKFPSFFVKNNLPASDLYVNKPPRKRSKANQAELSDAGVAQW
jgi:hypothetical protein